MNDERGVVSKRLIEVWEWKEAVYREVANLPTDQALAAILEKAREATEASGLTYGPSRSAILPPGK